MPAVVSNEFQEYYSSMEEWFVGITERSNDFEPYLRRALLRSGKRIRPIFALLSCEAICGDFTRALPIAVAYELAHDASLIQDDIMDRSPKRRYSRSVYSEFGLNTAILTSDLLIFEIFSLLSTYGTYSLSKSRICKLLEVIGRSARETTLGEFMDNQNTSNLVSESAYLDLIRKKTGALIAASAACGGIVGGSSSRETDLLYKFGMNAGVAYQIQDDILDLMADEDFVGKTTFSDIRNRKKNIVLIHAMTNAPRHEQVFLQSLLGKNWFLEDEVERGREILKATGSIDYAKRVLFSIIEEAKQDLLKLRRTSGREKLIDFWYSLSRYAADSEGPIVRGEKEVPKEPLAQDLAPGTRSTLVRHELTSKT